MRTLTLIHLLLIVAPLLAQDVKLAGTWKFHIGDKSDWSSPKFDDSGWEYIHAPAAWEDEGFNGYDGFAWYRRKFNGKLLDKNETYVLNLGYIDDCDEVFVNGYLVGFSGTMPPKFKTAYNSERKYSLPNDVLNFNGDNVIAVRVFDVTISGGIVDGSLGIYKQESNHLLVDLQGLWNFTTTWGGERVKDTAPWDKIMVPGAWEIQGYKFDGYGWYKKEFILPPNYDGSPLVLMLGRIDDFDEVYLNGKEIGSTNDGKPFGSSDSYRKLRAYNLPAGALKKSGKNLIEVLVEDMGNVGGIYEGPVGITTKANYNRYFYEKWD